ncbi:MAG: hypothetical protein A2341_18480 [Deltaproteobacteria bacterium RIFOXYB12_FULL_58_9]|nr:MAG: hypothetical protein A2341_18480 [Deltaproteobacteria bacterium RIFOXYB12_FULL_58_9]
MKLSTRARYALRMMLEIARDPGDVPISLGTVAEKTEISRRYLDQLAIGLKRASLVRGRSGKGGGYQLTRSPKSISARQIIEAAIGPVNIVDCVGEPQTCLRSGGCECRSVYELINVRINDVLDEISLADLVDREGLPGLVGALKIKHRVH